MSNQGYFQAAPNANIFNCFLVFFIEKIALLETKE
jgi:hypothetical protein